MKNEALYSTCTAPWIYEERNRNFQNSWFERV